MDNLTPPTAKVAFGRVGEVVKVGLSLEAKRERKIRWPFVVLSIH